MVFTDLLPWQESWWNEFRKDTRHLPHALVFYGPRGIGKVEFARYVGRALLCQNPNDLGRPCGVCAACGWIKAGNHPDYRLIRPEAIELAEGVESSESDGDGATLEAPVEPGAAESEGGKSKRAPSKEIRIQQIRQLADMLALGTHRGGRRVILIYPADAMNVFTANALLKMLEEPPESTVFILITDALDRLLPTILSRCQKVALAPPRPDVALAWLTGQGVADALRLLAEEGGAPLAALFAAQEDEVRRPQREALFGVLAKPEFASCLAVAERLSKCESALVVGWIQRWVYDCLGYRLAGRIRYYPSQKSAIATLAGSLDVTRALAYARTLVAENRLVDHPLNARLFVENLLLGYCLALQKI